MHPQLAAIDHLLVQLHLAMPQPAWWTGPAARSCAAAIEQMVGDLRLLRARLAGELGD